MSSARILTIIVTLVIGWAKPKHFVLNKRELKVKAQSKARFSFLHSMKFARKKEKRVKLCSKVH